MDSANGQNAHNRHFGMDWLRIGAFALLIFYHIGMFYVPWDWHVKSDPTVWWATIPMFFTNGWRLGLLFLVSGYASAAMLAKKPAVGPFLRNRTARLLVPLLFGILVIVPPQPWVELQFKHGYTGGFAHFLAQDYFRFGSLDGIVLPTWQHLWFVAYLWPYTLALGALLCLPRAVLRALGAWFEGLFARPALLVLLPIAWLVLRALVLFPGVEETHAFADDFAAHAEYLPMFLFGFALQRAPRVWEAIARSRGLCLVLTLVSYVVVAAIEWHWPGDTPAPDIWTPIFRIARCANAWAMIIALLGLANRFGNRDHPWRATLNEAIFPFYIVHQTLIVLVAWACLRLSVPNGISFPLLVLATVAGCWAFYCLGRASGPLRIFFGLRPHAQGDRNPAIAAA